MSNRPYPNISNQCVKKLKQFKETYRGFYIEEYFHILSPRALDVLQSRLQYITLKELAIKYDVNIDRIRLIERRIFDKIIRHRETLKEIVIPALKTLVNSSPEGQIDKEKKIKHRK